MMSELHERYMWVANELNKLAYAMQVKGRATPLKQFMPCDKALLFTEAITRKRVAGEVIPVAAITPCNCHPGLSPDDLWKMFDDAGKVVRSERKELT
jgi:hypothetical protein